MKRRIQLNLRPWLLLLGLLMLAGGSYWLQQPQDELAPPLLLEENPDAVMENFSALRLDKLGQPLFALTAEKMTYFNQADILLLEVPRLEVNRGADRPAWHVIASRGEMLAAGDEVKLYENIELLREATSKHNELRIQTDFLQVFPERGVMRSDHPVLITDAHSHIQAGGLNIDNQARTLTLTAGVKANHAMLD